MKIVVKSSRVIVYFTFLLFIPSYFDLGIPTEVLLKKLLSKLPIAILLSLFIVWFEDWAMKKGGLLKSEEKKD